MPECWGLLVRVLLASLVWPWQGPHKAEASSMNNAPEHAEVTCPYTTNQSYLNSFLWTIKTEPPSYFFGTIHVPYTKVWDFIPENTKEAFERSDNVFFELDLTDPYTISTLANCQLLPAGESLSNLLPRDLYRRLKRHLEYVKLMMPVWMTADQRGRGLYADYLFNAITGNWERKRPVWVMLMVNSLTEGDIKSRGIPVLDLYLAQEAERMNKQTGAVERVEEQCVPLNELNFSQVLFALNQTLMQHENYRFGEGTMPYTTNDLISHYNCGDLNSVIYSHDTAQVPNLVNNSLPPGDLVTAQHIDDYFRHELIYKRNLRMAERVDQLLKSQPDRSFFFAFGAGHFLGNNSVLDRLREMGYEVEHTTSDSEVYLGANYKKKKRKHVFSSRTDEYPVSPVMINGQGEYLDPFYDRRRHRIRHRHQRQRKKGRRRERYPTATDSYRLKQPQFNDLWVRLEATSFGPDAFFRKHGVTTVAPPPTPSSTTYSSCERFSCHVLVMTAIILSTIYTMCSNFLKSLNVCR